MASYVPIILVFGTCICMLGFLSRPRSTFELLRPMYVVPALIWGVTFFQAIQYQFVPESWSTIYSDAREKFGGWALIYTICCVLAFFLGFLFPLGKRLARPLVRIEFGFSIRPESILHIGFALGIILNLAILALVGPAVYGFGPTWGFFGIDSAMGAKIGPAVIVLVGVGAACVGIGFPMRGQRGLHHWLEALVALFLLSVPYMSAFSRGSGFPVLVAVVARIVQTRRLRWMPLILALLWVGMAGHAGLAGRGLHGHYAGVWPYVKYLVTDSLFEWDLGGGAEGTVGYDAYTPLCVTFTAIDKLPMGQLTLWEWLRLQIPIPRIPGIHPEWTFTLTYYVGGFGSWGYTSGMLGDTFGHFKWWGVIPFFVLGICYRVIDLLCFGERGKYVNGVLSIYTILLFTSYYAMLVGLFNNFRTWTSAFFYPTYLVLGFTLLRHWFSPRQVYTNEELYYYFPNEFQR